MANEITTNDQVAGRPALALLALSPRPWTTEAALSALDSAPETAIASALAYLEQAFVPVPTIAAERDAWKAAMDERLRRLAVKISAAMSPAQSAPWREVMVDALSDLPAMVALTAAKRAIHRPMSFLNEVEGVVREMAATVIQERRRARERLIDLRADLARPRRAALPPQEDGAPFSADEICKMSDEIRSMGLSGELFGKMGDGGRLKAAYRGR